MPWSLASLLLTNTRAAQAQEVGGFQTKPAITTHCNNMLACIRMKWEGVRVCEGVM